MPRYNIWTEHINHPRYIVDANNADEALGRARERYNLKDSMILYAIPLEEEGYTLEVVALADVLHGAGLRVYKAWQYAKSQRMYMAASRYEAIFASLNRQYTACISLADILDRENRIDHKIRLDKETTRAIGQPVESEPTESAG